MASAESYARVSVFKLLSVSVYLLFLSLKLPRNLRLSISLAVCDIILRLQKPTHTRCLGGSKQVMGLIMAGDSASKLILSQ